MSGYHRIVEELLAAHELFRRLGFVPTELGPIATERQIPFQAVHGDRTFRIDVCGGKAASACNKELCDLVVEQYPRAALWWNSVMTPEHERMRVWLNSAAYEASGNIVHSLARKGFPLAEMAAAKGKS